MRRIAFVAIPALLSGCALQVRAVPPEPVATVSVNAPAPPDQPAADVQVEAVPSGDPEEVSATSEPPDPVYEEQTDSPGATYVWVGGYWGWNGVDWGWNWGRWALAPTDGTIYIEPYYERVGDRVVYVHGYWGPRDAPRRSYGGERIHFVAATRPANYVRGEHTVVERKQGPAPGKRPGGGYEKATGTAHAVPKETTPHRTAMVKDTTPRGGKEASSHETGPGQHEAPGHEHEAKAEGSTTGRQPGHEGHEGTAPGHEGHEATAGHEGTAPGHEGHEATTGHEGREGTAPGHEGTAPGHEGAAPGHEAHGGAPATTTRTTTTTTTTRTTTTKGPPPRSEHKK